MRIGYGNSEDLNPVFVPANRANQAPAILWWKCANQAFEFAYAGDFFCWKYSRNSEVRYIKIPREDEVHNPDDFEVKVLKELNELCDSIDGDRNSPFEGRMTAMTIDACEPHESARTSQSGLISDEAI